MVALNSDATCCAARSTYGTPRLADELGWQGCRLVIDNKASLAVCADGMALLHPEVGAPKPYRLQRRKWRRKQKEHGGSLMGSLTGGGSADLPLVARGKVGGSGKGGLQRTGELEDSLTTSQDF